MISVVIPTYNRKELLLRAIDSVLRQTCTDLECIVVDDASTDDTAQAVRRIADLRVRYVRQERNAGACAARNCGIALAKGEYIAFQDSDDVWDADKLEKQLALIRKTGADFVVCAMRRVSGIDRTEVFPAQQPEGLLTLDKLLYENLCSTQCILGRAEAVRAVGFDDTMPRLQDWDMILRAAEQFRVYFHPEPLCDVYVQPDSISRQPRKLLLALRKLYGKFHAAINAPQRQRALPPYGVAVSVQWLRSLEQAASVCAEPLWTEELLLTAPEWVVRREQKLPGRILIHTSEPPGNTQDGAVHLVMQMAGFRPEAKVLFLPDVLLPDVLSGARDRVEFARPRHFMPPCDGETKAIRTGLSALSAWKGRRFAWSVLEAAYGGVRVAAELSALFLLDLPAWGHDLRDLQLPAPKGKIRRVGMYYHSLSGGGVQRAAAALVNIWVQMGYEVTAVTAQTSEQSRNVPESACSPAPDKPGAEYPIPKGVRRIVIPAMDPTRPEACRAHTAALAEAACNLDLLVYHAWADPLVLYDLLAVRSAGCRFLVHTHSTFTMPLLEEGMLDRFEALPDVYTLAHGVVTLSETDACYWRSCSGNVFTTVNPPTYEAAHTPVNHRSGLTILWAGRLSAEKRPMDALAILRQVVYAVPDARLILLGGGNMQMADSLRRCIDADGLRDHVILPGYADDMEPWYRQADVFLCTSAYEGFGLAMAEAQTFGIPVVSYDMPYLTILQGGGCVCVPQGDVHGAAQAVIRLLTDGAYRREMGIQARLNVENNLSTDQAQRWRTIFAALEDAAPQVLRQDPQTLMLRTLREHVLLSKGRVAAGQTVHQTAFVPLPEKGPFKALRKKAATFAQVLLIDGPEGVARVIREKSGR